MINSKLTEEVFNQMYQNPKNKLCFECQAQSHQWASVNNGIFLCLQCSGKHRGLGVNVSFVRSVGMDTWSQKQLDMMLQGGNEKLQQFFDSYNIPKEAPIDFKFKTKAAIYYRDMLKCMVEGVPVPEPPSQEEALELVDFSNPNFKIDSTPQGLGSQQEEEKQEEEPLDIVKGFFVQTFNKTKEVGKVAYDKSSELAKEAQNKMEEKYNDPEFQNNLTNYKEKAKQGAQEISVKGQEIATKGYDTLKTGLTSAWSFFKQKTGEIQQQHQDKNLQSKQQPDNNEDNDDITLENNDQQFQKQ